jgi:hypothetical protein
MSKHEFERAILVLLTGARNRGYSVKFTGEDRAAGR